ncbi:MULTISPECIES: pyridoxamine 5'-phosphate oxidase family protein [unclassified Nocardiopsis]|jgi:nitroimidazol reductase NimA-like FMN-containing flavoprotein (pyridoxamine 5'-phosphate oxidase superfamily)|uniref:pyridoxamine 5'-phosphate oxidase family protein n=1 Tax=unclassified Nocardiopsis TaxID=2649073 RepID=UPI00066D4659|nr:MULTISPECIES: pyridoxamine 5'-phosphate oxidase family protein [unclassified Nocardiopsis]MBQ1079893.1 pyridoxamine 5'-phosphate oxidase family protein [Nocardiopsis sp. B62]
MPDTPQPTAPFDVDAFLSQPLVARVATVNASGAPTVRPVWFLWEKGVLWWITGEYAVMARHLERDPRTAVVVDTCDLERQEFLQVILRGEAEVVPFDPALSRRKLRRYLGDDESTWHPDFRYYADDARLVRFVPDRTVVKDLSKSFS